MGDDIFRELEKAMAEHKQAKEAESAARSSMCAATNRLNEAQRAIDAYFSSLRKQAPWNTDWSSQERRSDSAPGKSGGE